MKTIQLLAIVAALGALAVTPRAAAQEHFETLYNVTGNNPVGLTANNGSLYVATAPGTEIGGGCGTVFELQPPVTDGGPWAEVLVHTFAAGGDACDPIAPPVLGANGALYGVTYAGGAYNFGALYELQPPTSPGGGWTESVVYSFIPPGSDTGSPVSNLLPGPGGSFYLATDNGLYGAGALVEMQPPAVPGGAWTATLLCSLPAGGGPPTSLSMGADGVFYATILYGGTAPEQLGEVFQLTRPAAPGGAWTETVLHNFGYANGEASTPNSLAVARDGTLYGTTYGTTFFQRGTGAVFEITPPTSPGGHWVYTVLENFGPGGIHPDSPLILRNGNLYGAVSSSAGGVLFELQPPVSAGGAWTTTYLRNFRDGQMPGGAMVMDSDGTIYGVTVAPTAHQPGGTVFRITSK